MNLTAKIKSDIDAMTYEQLLRKWRAAPIGDLMFQGESGDYFAKRMMEVRANTPNDVQVQASKNIGW